MSDSVIGRMPIAMLERHRDFVVELLPSFTATSTNFTWTWPACVFWFFSNGRVKFSQLLQTAAFLSELTTLMSSARREPETFLS